MGGTGIFGWLGDSLFGASPYTPTQRAPNITPDPPGGYGGGTLAGLLDPRGIREQAAWSGLGALSQGLLAAGMRRAAGTPSPLPQAFGAFQPAYQGALQSGYQTAGAEQQFRQREAQERTRQEQEQNWQAALAAATPAERALMQQMGQAQWAQMQGHVEAARRTPTRPQLVIGPNGEQTVWDADAYTAAMRGRGATPPAGGPPPAGGAAPGGAPSGQPAPTGDTRVPVGVRNNNWLSMSPGGRVAQYETPEVGIAAASQTLDRLFPSGTVTPRQLVQTWAQGPNYDPARVAPGIRASVENYGTAVARAAGVDNPDQPINLRDPATRLRVMQAMGQFETGGLPQGADAVIARGVALAADRRYMPQQGAQAGGAMPSQAAPVPAAQAPTQGGYVAPGPAPQVSAEVQTLFDRARTPPPAAAAPPAPAPASAQAQPSIPGVTVLRAGQRPVGEPVQVVGPNGQPMFVTREQAISQGLTPYHAPPAPQPLTTIMTPKGPVHVTREQALGQPAVPHAGMSVTTIGPDGQPITVQVGGTPRQPGDTTAPTARALEEQIIGNTARLDRLRTIQTRFRPEFLQLPTQFEAWTSAFTERLGRTLPPDQRQRLTEYTQFRSDAFRELNETIREMSGTAVSASEGERVLQAAPNVDRDSPSQFQAKMQGTIEAVRLANARLHYYRRIGIQPSFRGSDTGPIPLSNMRAVINGRGDEIASNLAREGVPRETINERVQRQLITEFGIE